jgi:hypothetical protein
MKYRMICLVAVTGLCMMLQSGMASADTPEGVTKGCKAVGLALSALGGYVVGQPFGPAAISMTTAVTVGLGTDALSAKCEDYYRALERQKDSFDYEEFVANVCGGNPLACPNGYNSMGDLPMTPVDCSTFIVCSVPLVVGDNVSLTVNDLINGGTFVDLSYQAGYWDYHRYGHLVGVVSSFDSGEYLYIH